MTERGVVILIDAVLIMMLLTFSPPIASSTEYASGEVLIRFVESAATEDIAKGQRLSSPKIALRLDSQRLGSSNCGIGACHASLKRDSTSGNMAPRWGSGHTSSSVPEIVSSPLV